MKQQASNIRSLKSGNRSLILNEIRKQPCSRVQLSVRTGLTRSAITMIVQDLIRAGQVRETKALQSERGRRQILLDIVPDYRVAVGIALFRSEVVVVLTDLRGNAIDQSSKASTSFRSRTTAMSWAQDTLRSMLQDHAFRPEKLVGIGISSPGPLDLSAGRILEPIDYALFCNFDVVREVSSWILDPADGRSVAAYRLPVSLENMAVLMGVREFYKENSKLTRYRQILYVTVSQGVGSCIINDGQIYRGFGGYAGELGHTSIDGAGRPCSCGNFGCLERYVTLPAICDFFNLESYEVLIDQAFTGQARSLAILEQISDWLTTALVNAVNLFDVDAIVLYGELSYRPQLLTEFLQKRISQRSLVGHAHAIDVLASEFDDKTAALASTAAVIDQHFKPVTEASQATPAKKGGRKS